MSVNMIPYAILQLILTLTNVLATNIDVELLNKNGALFDKSECLLLLYALTPLDAQVSSSIKLL